MMMMRKRTSLITLCLLFCFLVQAQLQSPDQFLGYKIGTRYTPHWKMVSYYQHVAAAVPGMVQLQNYGQTNEGRPLMVAFVSDRENITNLQAIRNGNLRLAGVEPGAAASNQPVIVWLSYNVHGNETSSSEAAMQTLFALVDP